MKRKLKIPLIINALIFAGTLVSCQNEANHELTEQMSSDEVWIDSIESDGISGSTALGDAKDIDWNSPLARLKHFLDSNGFMIDTSRLNKLADYAYQDLRKTRFSKTQHGLVNILSKDMHSMSGNSVLLNGEGYYFAKIDKKDKYSGMDIGFECWKIDASNPKEVEKLKHWWKDKYHPMPLYVVIKNDNLYALYTRSVQFAPFLEKCVEIVEK